MATWELRKDNDGARKIVLKQDPIEALLAGESSSITHPYLLGQVEAASWLEAKRLFELPLTEIQAKLASGQITHFELFGRHWSAADLDPLSPTTLKE